MNIGKILDRGPGTPFLRNITMRAIGQAALAQHPFDPVPTDAVWFCTAF
jgi:hypothetical protein